MNAGPFSNTTPEKHHIAVFDDIILAFEPLHVAARWLGSRYSEPLGLDTRGSENRGSATLPCLRHAVLPAQGSKADFAVLLSLYLFRLT